MFDIFTRIKRVETRSQMLREQVVRSNGQLRMMAGFVEEELQRGDISEKLQETINGIIDQVSASYHAVPKLHTLLRYVRQYECAQPMHRAFDLKLSESFSEAGFCKRDLFDFASGYGLIKDPQKNNLELTLWGEAVLERWNDLSWDMTSKISLDDAGTYLTEVPRADM